MFNTDVTTAGSETNTSYEAGFKSRLFDNRLQLNAAGFTYNVDNIQLSGQRRQQQGRAVERPLGARLWDGGGRHLAPCRGAEPNRRAEPLEQVRFYLATDWNIQGFTNFVVYKAQSFTASGSFEGGARFRYNTGR